jgi:hypothetical protein
MATASQLSQGSGQSALGETNDAGFDAAQERGTWPRHSFPSGNSSPPFRAGGFHTHDRFGWLEFVR